MARNRAATVRRLSVEQDSFLRVGNMLTTAFRGETDEQALIRLFGDRDAAVEAWQLHRHDLMTVDPHPGTRPWAWWVLEKQREVPLQSDQPELLRQLGKLTARESDQLEAWRRMVPEPPTDISIDHVNNITTTEAIDNAQPDPAPTPGSWPAASGPPPRPALVTSDAEGHQHVDDDHPGEEDVSPTPAPDVFLWPQERLLRRRPPELEGWS